MKYLGSPPLLEYFDNERRRMVRFKSKHEWNWAIYLELAHLDWEYEPLTFLSPDKCTRDRRLTYTPDFGVNRNTVMIEIKTYREKHVRNRLDFCNLPLILIFGLPSKNDMHVYLPNVRQSYRCTDWTAAYALARNGLPAWIAR